MMEIDLHLIKRKYGNINEAKIEKTSMVKIILMKVNRKSSSRNRLNSIFILKDIIFRNMYNKYNLIEGKYRYLFHLVSVFC